MTASLASGPAGRSIPGGSYRIAGYENLILRDAVYADPGPLVHPIAAFIGAQRGMGLSVAELFELMDCSIEDGPVLAGSTIELTDDLLVDTGYRVEGAIVSAVRKNSVTAGVLELVTCRFTLSGADSSPVAVVTNVYAIRRAASDDRA